MIPNAGSDLNSFCLKWDSLEVEHMIHIYVQVIY